MRKEARTNINVNVKDVQGYHCGDGDGRGHEGYAFNGFTRNLYFNSDRAEPTAVENGVLVRTKTHAPLLAFCPEIEIECETISDSSVLAEILHKVIFPNFKFGEDMFKVQHDGSLGGESSAEIIPQPMTKGRIRNDYASYKAMWDYFGSLGIHTDGDRTDCGMHINISNAVFGKTEEEQIENLRKLYFLINEHYVFFRKLFHRNQYKTGWCKQMTAENMRWSVSYTVDANDVDYHNARNLDFSKLPNDHGLCLNYSHFKAGRIEIRLPGGAKGYYGFRNTMETAFFLAERICKVKWEDLNDLVKFFKGCNQYVLKRIADECVDGIHFTPTQYEAVKAASKIEDLELH